MARLVDRLNKLIGHRKETPSLLLGPGRWGTTTPAMCVPVTFPEINNIIAITEIAYKDCSLIPDLSFGTHFFRDLVKMDIFVYSDISGQGKSFFNFSWLEALPNRLAELSARNSHFAAAVRVCDVKETNLRLLFDVATQQLICFAEGINITGDK